MSNQIQGSDKKVLILGLNNSGKTSILLSFKKETNILSYCSLKPTRRINREKFSTQETDMSVWDFGGQEKYRSDYLLEFQNYLPQVTKIIYVIDVQDIKRFDEAISYFTDILNKLKEQSTPYELSIYLHKYDPYLSDQEGFENIDDLILEKLILRIKEIVPDNFELDFFETTIFSTFKKTLHIDV